MEHDSRLRTRLVLGFLAAGALAAASATLSGCNTVEGAGEDLQEASQNVRDAINDNDDD